VYATASRRSFGVYTPYALTYSGDMTNPDELDAAREWTAQSRAELERHLAAVEGHQDKQRALEVAYLIALNQHEGSQVAAAVRNRIAAALYQAKSLSLTGLGNLVSVTKSAAQAWVDKGSKQREDSNG
jgi:hypothetical protein